MPLHSKHLSYISTPRIKRRILPGVLALGFIASSFLFWNSANSFYRDPFNWLSFDNSFNLQLIPLGISAILMILFAALLAIIKRKTWYTKVVFVLGALLQFLYISPALASGLSALVFVLGFVRFDANTDELFHRFIKIRFWDTYWHTIPGVLVFLAITLAVGMYAASEEKVDQLEITIPRNMIEQSVDMLLNALPGIGGFGMQSAGEASPPGSGAGSMVPGLSGELLEMSGLLDNTDPDNPNQINLEYLESLGVLGTSSARIAAEEGAGNEVAGNEATGATRVSDITPIPQTETAALLEISTQGSPDQGSNGVSEDEIYNDLITSQLEKYGITDPAEVSALTELITTEAATSGADIPTRDLLEQVVPLLEESGGLSTLETIDLQEGPSNDTTEVDLLTDDTTLDAITSQLSESENGEAMPLNSILNGILNRGESGEGGSIMGNLRDQYREILINQAQREVELRVNAFLPMIRDYIPVLNAITVFFLISIINLPVMIISIMFITAIMSLLRKLGVIAVVKVQTEVERLAW